MPADPFTPAELEAGVYPDAADVKSAALAMEAADRLGSRPLRRPAVYRALAYAGLAAAAPLIAARVRTDSVRPYQQRVEALEALLACYRIGKQPSEALHRRLETTRAAVARAHRTTEEPDHADR